MIPDLQAKFFRNCDMLKSNDDVPDTLGVGLVVVVVDSESCETGRGWAIQGHPIGPGVGRQFRH